MARLFGTDGVRGIANVELTCQVAYRLGQAAVVFLGKTIVIGKDTRLSGDMLEAALIAGITSAGGTALMAGVIPTPAVALLVRKLSAAGGAVISASHNPPEYNGIKLFDSNGFKLSDDTEDAIEAFIMSGGLENISANEALKSAPEMPFIEMPKGSDLGFSVALKDAAEIYISHTVSSIESQGINFSGYKVAIDAGHGASCKTTPEAFRRLGAEVFVLNDDYDGTDINVKCGSTHLQPLQQFVLDVGADVGVAHDGDADRVLLVTPEGETLDGDIIEAVIALDMKSRGTLAKDTVVTTVMSNLGFTHAMRDAGIDVVQTKVGDRYVLEQMRSGGYSIGGEQSGHMIMLEHNSTGDGLMTAVQFMAASVRSGKSVSDAANVMQKYPQALINVRVDDKDTAMHNGDVVEAVKAAETELGCTGRVLLRPSGTEPVVRVMVEAESAEEAERFAKCIAYAVEQSS